MKAKHTTKGAISLLLSLLMVISMITVGIVSAASAENDLAEVGAVSDIAEEGAELDVAEEGASEMEVYFTKPSGWNAVKLHYWGGSSSSSWPGVDMTYKYTNDFKEAVYYKTIPANTTGIIFNNGSGTQSQDITVTGKQVVAYYMEGTTAKSWTDIPAPSGGGGTTPTAPPVTGDKIRLAVADSTDDRWLGNDDAQFKVKINGAYTDMTKSVDVASGLKVWYADVAAIGAGTQIVFDRISAIDPSNVFNSFATNYVANSPLYVVSGKGGDTITPSTMLDIPDGSATNFGYGIWVDAKGDGNTKDFIKIYAADFKNDTTYHLYLPAFVDTTALKVYTNFPSCTINGTAVTKGQVNTLNIPLTSVEKDVSISFKRNTAGSVHNGTLHIMRSGAAAMFMTTKMELYSGLTAAYAADEHGNADYAGVASYKSLVNTKGDYLFYDKTGKVLNSKDKTTGELLTGLKKIKGRGNSSFEASMRLYGKYAYNITLNDKAKLIDGCESSKKYCLLANNADESLMRNTTVFGIADAIGMPYTPNTRLIDLYDNGNYLGAYIITEKVEYGKSTLIPTAKSLDKANEDILAAGKGINYDNLKQTTATYTAKSGNTYRYCYSYNPSGAAYEFDGTTVTIGEGEKAETYTLDDTLMHKYDFLLEHEIDARYEAEATWFISNRTKQAVVPKYPEFATKKEVQWMIDQYDAMETAAYANNYASFASVADADSFASVYLIQELTMNLDAAATSYYILGGGSYDKLLAAPLWDYDWAVGAYNGKKLTVSGEVDVSDVNKVFVKNKSVKIDSTDSRTQGVYNLQAKLCQNTSFWNGCKRIWTNQFVPVLADFLDEKPTTESFSGVIINEYLPAFTAAQYMNESRWGLLAKVYSDPDSYWGTRSTARYRIGSYNFGIGSSKVPDGAAFGYQNTVYYINDWLYKRELYMSNSMGLYDTSMIETEPPTEKPTEKPTEPPTEKLTEKPTEKPTQAPTDPPTDPPTEPPTEKPTEKPTEAPTQPPTEEYDPRFQYRLGDTDGDGEVTIMDATAIQRLLADYTYEDYVRMVWRSIITGDNLNIMDATAIQRFIADYENVYGIGEITDY